MAPWGAAPKACPAAQGVRAVLVAGTQGAGCGETLGSSSRCQRVCLPRRTQPCVERAERVLGIAELSWQQGGCTQDLGSFPAVCFLWLGWRRLALLSGGQHGWAPWFPVVFRHSRAPLHQAKGLWLSQWRRARPQAAGGVFWSRVPFPVALCPWGGLGVRAVWRQLLLLTRQGLRGSWERVSALCVSCPPPQLTAPQGGARVANSLITQNRTP